MYHFSRVAEGRLKLLEHSTEYLSDMLIRFLSAVPSIPLGSTKYQGSFTVAIATA